MARRNSLDSPIESRLCPSCPPSGTAAINVEVCRRRPTVVDDARDWLGLTAGGPRPTNYLIGSFSTTEGVRLQSLPSLRLRHPSQTDETSAPRELWSVSHFAGGLDWTTWIRRSPTVTPWIPIFTSLTTSAHNTTPPQWTDPAPGTKRSFLFILRSR